MIHFWLLIVCSSSDTVTVYLKDPQAQGTVTYDSSSGTSKSFHIYGVPGGTGESNQKIDVNLPVELSISYSNCKDSLQLKRTINAGETECRLDFSTPEFSQCLKTNHQFKVTLNNGFFTADKITNAKLFYSSGDDQHVEIVKGTPYKYEAAGFEYSITVEYKNDICNDYQTIETLTEKTGATVSRTYRDSSITDSCSPYTAILTGTIPSGFTIKCKPSYDNKETEYNTDGVTFYNNDGFTVSFIFTNDICVDGAESEKKYTAKKTLSIEQVDFTEYIPDACKSYQIVFSFPNLNEKYKLGYSFVNSGGEPSIKELIENTPITDKSPFSVKLYLIQSPNAGECKNMELEKTYDALRTDNKIVLTNSIIPTKCTSDPISYEFAVKNSIDYEGYVLYFKDGDKEIVVPQGETVRHKYKTMQSIILFIRADGIPDDCTTSQSYPTYEYSAPVVEITNDDINSKRCKPKGTYHIYIDLSSVISSYKIEYVTSFDETRKTAENEIKIENETSFSVTLYATSLNSENTCENAILNIYTAQLSYRYEDPVKINEEFVSQQCQKADEPYVVCATIEIPEDYNISYTLSYENHKTEHEFTGENFSIKYKEPFTVRTIITSSKDENCDHIGGPIVKSSIVTKCGKFEANDIENICQIYPDSKHMICFQFDDDWESTDYRFLVPDYSITDSDGNPQLVGQSTNGKNIIQFTKIGPFSQDIYLTTDKCYETFIGTFTSDIEDYALCHDWNMDVIEGFCSSDKGNNNSLSAGAIAGIVIGCVAAVAIAGVLIWYFAFFRKSKVGASSDAEP